MIPWSIPNSKPASDANNEHASTYLFSNTALSVPTSLPYAFTRTSGSLARARTLASFSESIVWGPAAGAIPAGAGAEDIGDLDSNVPNIAEAASSLDSGVMLMAIGGRYVLKKDVDRKRGAARLSI